MPGRWPSPDPNSWANPRGRKKGKGTTTRARQARRAASPKALAKKEQRKAEAAAAEAAASAGTAAAASADPLQQGEKDTPAAAAAAAAAAEPLQQGGQDKAAAAAAAAAEPLQQGEKDTAAAAKPEPLQQEEKKEKEEEWETALGKRARSVQRRKASKERKQWQVKENPLPEGKPAEPLQEGKKKEKGRPASSAAGRRKLGGAMWGLAAAAATAPCQALAPAVPVTNPRGTRGDPSHSKREGVPEWREGQALGTRAEEAGPPAQEEGAGAGLAQCLSDPGGMEGCCARQAHSQGLGPPG